MAQYYLTRRALQDLQAIRKYSIENFGDAISKIYFQKLQTGLDKITKNPNIGKLRQHRSAPFFMAKLEQHFAIYERDEKSIYIAAILHSRQDIEAIIPLITDSLSEAINALKNSH